MDKYMKPEIYAIEIVNEQGILAISKYGNFDTSSGGKVGDTLDEGEDWD